MGQAPGDFTPYWGCKKTGKIWLLSAKPQEKGDVLGAEQAGRAAGMGYSIPHLAGAFQGVFWGFVFLW